MSGKFRTRNIREYFDSSEDFARLEELISGFSCQMNPEVETFLKKNAINFTLQNQSVTYLVFSEDDLLVGYFSLAVKPLEIEADKLSSTFRKRLARVSRYDEKKHSYSTAAYLIAQLGKNFTEGMNEKISGSELLELARDVLKGIQYDIGGVTSFVEAENIPALLDFYARNNFFIFGKRKIGEQEFIQLIRNLRQ